MRRFSIRLTAWVVCAAACFATATGGQEKRPARRDKASVWMEKKLEFARNLLVALTQANFAELERNAENLNFVSHLEKWERAGEPRYKLHAAAFEFANQELIRQAKEKNLDGATLAYNQLTLTCVQCHKIVRDAKKKP